jgi:hypothetical protein
MLACAKQNGLSGFNTVAITQLPEEEEGAIGSEVSNPNQVADGWEFLGYDVADYFLLSALMNSPYKEHEVEDLKARFASKLNEHHLFATIQPAEAFMLLADERLPEHAPFYVYGLYLVR